MDGFPLTGIPDTGDTAWMLASSALVLGLVIAPIWLAGASVLVLEAQHALRSKGYDPGAVDGVYGPKTRAAVLDFEKNSCSSSYSKPDTYEP